MTSPFTAEDYRQLLEMSGSRDVANTCIMENIVKRERTKKLAEEAAAKALYLKAMRQIPYAAFMRHYPMTGPLEGYRHDIENGISSPIISIRFRNEDICLSLGDELCHAYLTTDDTIVSCRGNSSDLLSMFSRDPVRV
tara:strand:- start:284 stop:697 length:414 start_codon:yes stop_codon:yes gene_type:complete